MNFRNGQWVSFDLSADLAPIKDRLQKTADGLGGVGIFVKPGHISALDKDNKPLGTTEEYVSPIGPDGKDIFDLVGLEVCRAKLDPTRLKNLKAVVHRGDLPVVRIAHKPADWHPHP